MYRLVRFGNYDLDQYNQVDDVGSGDTPTHYLPLPEGGALDGFGNLQKHPGSVERAKSLRLRVSTETALSTLYFRLLALRGKRDRLYRRLVDGTLHWQYARLVSVEARRDYGQTKFRHQDVALRFATGEVTWRGETRGLWFLNDGHLFNDGLLLNEDDTLFALTADATTEISLPVGSADDPGRAPVRNMRITVQAGDAEISYFGIARAGGEAFEVFLPDYPEGFEKLVIDTASRSVQIDDNDAYDALQISVVGEGWFSLAPGENTIHVNVEGGGEGATIMFGFQEAWY